MSTLPPMTYESNGSTFTHAAFVSDGERYGLLLERPNGAVQLVDINPDDPRGYMEAAGYGDLHVQLEGLPKQTITADQYDAAVGVSTT